MLIDIMIKGHFVCQMNYNGRGQMEIIDGEAVTVYDPADIARYVEQRRPSLIGKPYRILFSSSPVIPKSQITKQ